MVTITDKVKEGNGTITDVLEIVSELGLIVSEDEDQWAVDFLNDQKEKHGYDINKMEGPNETIYPDYETMIHKLYLYACIMGRREVIVDGVKDIRKYLNPPDIESLRLLSSKTEIIDDWEDEFLYEIYVGRVELSKRLNKWYAKQDKDKDKRVMRYIKIIDELLDLPEVKKRWGSDLTYKTHVKTKINRD